MIADFAPDKKVSSAMLSTICEAALPAVSACFTCRRAGSHNMLMSTDKPWAALEQPCLHRCVSLQEGALMVLLHGDTPLFPASGPPPMCHCDKHASAEWTSCAHPKSAF